MKHKYTTLLAAGMVLLTSCDNYLKENHYNQVLPKTAEDYGALLYNQLSTIESLTQSVTLEYYYRALEKELYADNLNASMNKGRSLKVFYAGDNVTGNMYVFMRGYTQIKDYNIILDEVQGTDTLSQKLRTTARIMRGVTYYNLMRDMCEPWESGRENEQLGLPLVSEFDMEAKPARSSLKATADFIVSDLETALNEGQKDPAMLFTDEVAKAYLARTYFWSEQWDKALQLCQSLLKDHPLLEGKAYTEMIESPQSPKGNVLIMSSTGYSKSGYNQQVKKLQERPLAISFYKLFPEKARDVRFKYISKTLTTTKQPFVGMRSAELALMAMECLAHLNRTEEALAMLNDFRAHRISPYEPLTQATLPAVDSHALIQVDALGQRLTPLMQAILNERRKELLLEADRWYELKRNGMPEFWVTDGRTKKETKKYLYCFPLQYRDLLLNPALKENPGYVYEK